MFKVGDRVKLNNYGRQLCSIWGCLADYEGVLIVEESVRGLCIWRKNRPKTIRIDLYEFPNGIEIASMFDYELVKEKLP